MVSFAPTQSIKVKDVEYTKEEIKEMNRTELQELIQSVINSIGLIFEKRRDFIDNPKNIVPESLAYYKILSKFDKATISSYKNLVWLKNQKRKLDIKSELHDKGFSVNFMKQAKELLSEGTFNTISAAANEVYAEKVNKLDVSLSKRQSFKEFVDENFEMKKGLIDDTFKLKEDFTFNDGREYNIDPSFKRSEIEKLKFFYLAGQKST